MKTLILCFAIALSLTSSAFADIRSYHGGITIGVGGYHGHHRHHGHRNHHGFHHGIGRHHYNHGYFGLGYGSIFHPAYFSSNYSVPSYAVAERTVVIRERAPKAPRASTYAPTWKPGGWKTHPWYRSRADVVTTPDTLRDARSSAQLQQIYGEQAAGLAR